jgi:histidine triad (HIT) family protein
MFADNVFLKIIEGEIPAKLIHQDEWILAFHDIHPQAPVHVLIIPRKEIRTHAQIEQADFHILAKMHALAQKLAVELGLQDGYRLVINCDDAGGQTVPHLHLHLLGGRQLGWPPG